jgi:hypothetical protein
MVDHCSDKRLEIGLAVRDAVCNQVDLLRA